MSLGRPRALLGPPNLCVQTALGSSRFPSRAGQRPRESYTANEARPGLEPGLPARGSFKGLSVPCPCPCPWQWLLAGAVGATTTDTACLGMGAQGDWRRTG